MIFPFSHKIIVEFLTYLERRQQNKSKFFFFFLHCETSSPQGRKLRKEVATRYMYYQTKQATGIFPFSLSLSYVISQARCLQVGGKRGTLSFPSI